MNKKLKNFFGATTKLAVNNDLLNAQWGKGAIEGAVAVLMAQGADYEKAWGIVKQHLPENVSSQVIPKGWKF